MMVRRRLICIASGVLLFSLSAVAFELDYSKEELEARWAVRIKHLLSSCPNLYYDLAIGTPNRKYLCAGGHNTGRLVGDTAIWDGSAGNQKKRLVPVNREALGALKLNETTRS